MKSYFALIAVGLDAAATRFKSTIEKTTASVAAAFVGIGLLASPFLLQANDEETNNAPEVSCLWVSNHGSIGFTVEFDVHPPSNPSDPDKPIRAFDLYQEGTFIEREPYPLGESLYSNYCDWLSIPGFDGSTSTAPIGSHSFDFTIKGHRRVAVYGALGNPITEVYDDDVDVDISIYVTVNSEGALESMSAYAYDSDGDFYEVALYYSAGGGADGTFRTFED